MAIWRLFETNTSGRSLQRQRTNVVNEFRAIYSPNIHSFIIYSVSKKWEINANTFALRWTGNNVMFVCETHSSRDANGIWGEHKWHIVRWRCSFIGSKIPCINHNFRAKFICVHNAHCLCCPHTVFVCLKFWFICDSGAFHISNSLAAEIYAFRKCINAKFSSSFRWSRDNAQVYVCV